MSDFNLSELFELSRRQEELLRTQNGMLWQLLNQQPAKSEEQLINIDEAASLLMLKPDTLRRNINKLKIPHRYQFGRYYFLRSELIDYIKNRPSEKTKVHKPGQRRPVPSKRAKTENPD